jgi:hypothetical protein
MCGIERRVDYAKLLQSISESIFISTNAAGPTSTTTTTSDPKWIYFC